MLRMCMRGRGLLGNGRIESLLDNGGVLVTRVSLCLLTNVFFQGELYTCEFLFYKVNYIGINKTGATITKEKSRGRIRAEHGYSPWLT